MTEMRNPVYAPYGAYAMKASYQRNLALANVITAVMVGAVVLIGVLWPGEEAVTEPLQPIVISVIDLQGLQPESIIRDESAWPETPPAKMERVGFGIPTPVPDEEFAEEQDMVIASQQDIHDIIPRGGPPGDGQGVIVDTLVGEFGLEPTDFVPVEIPPRVVRHYHGDYPRMAEMIGAEGTVQVYVLLDEAGNPLEARLAQSSGTEVLDEAGMAWGMKCRFSPGIQNGRPIKIWVVVKYEFKLDR